MLLHKKFIVTVSLLSAVVFVATTAMKSSTVTDEPIFKNLKVLPKNISKEDLDKVMDGWRDALGVRCNFCHARNAETNKMDMASDAKPEKEMARNMMKMTAKINEKYFKMDKDDKEHGDAMTAAITCMTCHHGAAHPNSVASARPAGTFGTPPFQGSTPVSPATPPATTPTPPKQ
jgi:cytochrome c553